MRILVADDDRGILTAYKVAFASLKPTQTEDRLAGLAASLFGDNCAGAPQAVCAVPELDIVYVDQGLDAVAAVEEGQRTGNPFELAFLDMRMPPGIDGKETARLIRAADPGMHIVIVTGYSDHNPADVAKVAGPADKLGYLQKPFEIDEIVQLARTLSEKKAALKLSWRRPWPICSGKFHFWKRRISNWRRAKAAHVTPPFMTP